MTNTTEREQIVAYLRKHAGLFQDDGEWLVAGALIIASSSIERGDHLKESPHG